MTYASGLIDAKHPLCVDMRNCSSSATKDPKVAAMALEAGVAWPEGLQTYQPTNYITDDTERDQVVGKITRPSRLISTDYSPRFVNFPQ